jgi:hypothetical protein
MQTDSQDRPHRSSNYSTQKETIELLFRLFDIETISAFFLWTRWRLGHIVWMIFIMVQYAPEITISSSILFFLL